MYLLSLKNFCQSCVYINSLPDGKILDWSKLKALADKIKVTEKFKIILGRLENIVRKGENAGYQHFSPFPTKFSNGFSVGVVKSCVVKS